MSAVTAIVPAAGFGKRFGAEKNKPFYPFMGKPLLIWALTALDDTDEIDEIIPVLKEPDIAEGKKIIKKYGFKKIKRIAPGGAERQDSVRNGLNLVSKKTDVVLIHDGARPLIEKSLIKKTLSGLKKGVDGVIAAVPVKDTIKEKDKKNSVVKTLKRQTLIAVQTPQAFKYNVLISAYEKAMSEGFYSTDDSALVERYGGRVMAVAGSERNIKITTMEDLSMAETFLKIYTH
jgi:2-C-methyl-D-erythritol 4-phosphate cytidylyltransferase